jgi:hypothetical protein
MVKSIGMQVIHTAKYFSTGIEKDRSGLFLHNKNSYLHITMKKCKIKLNFHSWFLKDL